jgi:hypothetical protein
VARFFGPDASAELDQDLVRMKEFLEQGRPPGEHEGIGAARH